MNPGPPTRPSLLVRLVDHGDHAAWTEFVDLYAPVVFGYARRRGLQDADAADMTQEVFRSVAGAISRFDYAPARGGFRAWLFQITRNRVRSFLRQALRAAAVRDSGAPPGALDDYPDPDDDSDAVWEAEWQREVFARACADVRGRITRTTWEAFYQAGVLGRPGRDVAAELGLSVPAVYLAKSRVLAQIREYIEGLDRE